MSAKDYGFYPAALSGRVYLAKNIKNPHLMSQDRRIVTDDEIIGIFEHYLRRFCEENHTDTIVVKDGDKVVFTAKLNKDEKK